MKARDLRENTLEELNKQVNDLHEQLFKLRFQKATGQLDNVHKLSGVRRDLARTMTVINEKKRQQKAQEE